MNKTILSIGLVLLLAGVVFTFLPHEAHNSIVGSFAQEHEHHPGMEHGTHDTHLKTGYGIALAGLLLTICGVKIK